MAAIAEGVAVGAAAAAHQQLGGGPEAQLIGHLAAAEVGAIAEPAVAAAGTAAELVHPGGQLQRFGTLPRTLGGGIGLSHRKPADSGGEAASLGTPQPATARTQPPGVGGWVQRR